MEEKNVILKRERRNGLWEGVVGIVQKMNEKIGTATAHEYVRAIVVGTFSHSL